MADRKKGADLGQPHTGNGHTGGQKPKKADLLMLRRDGTVARHQPKGWMGKLLPFRRDGK